MMAFKDQVLLATTVILVTVTATSVFAATCPSEYGFYSRGTLNIDSGVTIDTGSGPIAVDTNNGGSEDGINPADGSLAVQSPLFSLPALVPANFPTFPGPNNGDLDVNSDSTIAPGTYDTITVDDNVNATFADTPASNPGTYYIDELEVKGNATITLAPGTYYIDQLTMEDDSQLIIDPTGSVTIYLNGEADIKDSVLINEGGTAGNLTFNLYNNADFEAGNDTKLTGVIYSPYNSSDIEIGNDSTVTGGLVTNGKLELKDNVALIYSASEVAAVQNVIPCSTSFNHIELIHDGAALTCETENITVRLCNSANDCSLPYVGAVNVTLTPSGWAGGNTQDVTDGQVLQLPLTSTGTYTLGVSSSAPVASSAVICRNTATGTNSLTDPAACNLTYYETGFTYTIPTQTSCSASSDITISAVTLDPTLLPQQVCKPTLLGETRDVTFSLTYNSPAIGTNDLTLTYAGTPYAIDNVTSQSVPIAFDLTTGQSTFTVDYPDAGQITLTASADDGLTSPGTATFVTKPAQLYVHADEANASCAAPFENCSLFKRAGEPFDLKVRGACSDNSLTPNFELSNLSVSHTNIAPAIAQGVLGIDTFSIDPTDNGEHTIAQTISEVGVFTFTVPDITVNDATSVYDGLTITGGAASNIGRFYPDHFCLSSNSIVNRTDPNTATTCTDGFSYLDEEFEARFTLTAQAMNAVCTDGTSTQNYHDTWSKFSTPFNEDTSNASEQGKWNLGAVNDPAGTPVNLNTRISINTVTSTPTNFTNGQAVVTTKININRSGAAPGYTAEAPFADVRVAINPIDTDTVGIDSPDLTIGTDTYREVGNTELYFGRLFAENAFGTDQTDVGLDMYARTEFCNAVNGGVCSNWQHKTDDSCTLYNINPPAGVQLGANPGSIGTPGYYQRASATVTSSVFDFNDDGAAASYARVHVPDTNNHSAGWRLFYTAGGNGGDFTIPFQFPFNTDTSVHPYLLHVDGVASFGEFRGDDRIIFWREILE